MTVEPREAASTGPIRVLIVDDSALVRQTMSQVLSGDPELEVVGVAADPFIAEDKIRQFHPDVITLDLEMPRMDGITYLRKLMSGEHPLPVVVCSSLTAEGAEATMKALEYGAVEIIQKPRLGTKRFIEESTIRLRDAVKAAAHARVRRIPEFFREVAPKLTADAMLARGPHDVLAQTSDKVIVVGASTGGTEAIRVFLEALPPDIHGVVIVQHMPEHFTTSFARRLNQSCRIEVKEAANGDAVICGRALVAPGNRHTLIKRSGARYFVEVKDGPLVCRHRPSVEVLFRSAARYAGGNAVGIIMTGMGDDGAQGLLEMREAGAVTIAQDEATSVVYGMPKEAVRRGAVEKILPLEGIAASVLRLKW